ncbi:iron ABC transporter permease [Herbiconiux moechotypicola]|uniref:Iron chelate uptake ABC transporter family permease subunit n=1 Tax=Herbiconiux moechotypicola TaxID=637393 RepID=A0ABP5Q1Q4_9MICO|nr:iron ABC transporter permease [Herbiconiux moechotypicola]MCS5728375.1 iron ABC transporter permease [Herbiconiux moechotypicola]
MRRTASRRRLALAFSAALVLLAAVVVLSLAVGARELSPAAVLGALVDPVGDDVSHIVWTVRVPRTALGLVVGAALALAGALMQAVTRNPLADPGLLGVNAGAAAAVVLAVVLGAPQDPALRLGLALLGAGVAAAIVIGLGSAGGAGGQGRLVLAGAAVSASLAGVVAGITLLDQEAFDQYRFWAVGSLADQPLSSLLVPAPALAAGLVLGLTLVSRLDVLALGDDGSSALGVHPARTRVLGLLAVVLLCGAATAVVGPITFLGLAVPHAARLICGPRSGWIVAFSLVLGPVLLLGADIIGRLVARPGEIEVAIVMGAVGAPVFIALVRTRSVPAL